MSRAGR